MVYHLAPSLAQLRAEVNAVWPGRSKASDGWIGDTAHGARKSDHNPDYTDGGVVRAIDLTNDGIDVDRLVRVACADSRTAYVISRGLIYTRDNGFRPVRYTGSNRHDHHVHISARHGSAHETSTASWGLSRPTGSGGSSAIRPAPPTSEEDDMPTAPEVANAVLNTPDPALGGRTLHEAIASLLRVPGDINTVHQAVLKTPATTAQALLSTRIKRAGLGKGETTLAAVLAWTDDYVMRALNATAQAGGTIDMAQVTAAVKAAADAALGDVELTLTTKGGAK